MTYCLIWYALAEIFGCVSSIKLLFSLTAECSFIRDTLTTFNSRRYKNEMPLSCYQVLAQDCTDELKFMVLLKKDHIEQNHINVKIADMWVSIKNKKETTVFIHKLKKPNNIVISALVVILTCTRRTLTWSWRSMEWKYPSTTCHTSIPQVSIHIHEKTRNSILQTTHHGPNTPKLLNNLYVMYLNRLDVNYYGTGFVLQLKSRSGQRVKASLCTLPAMVFMKSTLTRTHGL